MTLVPYVQTTKPLNHRKTVWVKMKVRSVNHNEGYIALETHPSLREGWDGFEVDTDDVYVEEQS